MPPPWSDIQNFPSLAFRIRGFSLLCYLSYSWVKDRQIHAFFKGIYTKVNATG